MKKWTSYALVGVLSTSMVVSSLPKPIEAKTFGTAKEAVKNLTEDQRAVIKKIEAQPSFTIDPQLLKERGKTVRVIVELKTIPIAEAITAPQKAKANKELIKKEYKAKIDKEQKTFKDKAVKLFKEKKVATPKITHTYTNTFNGVAMEIPTTEIQTLLQTGTVKRIWKDGTVQAPPPEKTSTGEKTPKLPAPLPFIGVDKLHGEGFNGKGIKVGVLDTGIDYNHPDLKDTYKGGYDFVDNDADPMETTPEDWKKAYETDGWPETYNGSTYYTSHGTHVAGTIASNPKNNVEYAMTGVAPNVDLHAYRVLGPYGSGATSGIIAAIERSFTDGMDIINLSLGAQINQSLSPLSVAINNVALLGVIPVIAAGNSGDGSATLGSPGTSPLAITVGASTIPTNVPTTTVTFGNTTAAAKLLASDYGNDETTVLNKQLAIVEAGLGKPEDFTGKDFTGKVALIQRGELPLVTKIENAKANGASAVIIYNNVDGEIPHFLGEVPDVVPAFKLTKADGQALIAALQANPTLTLSIGDLKENIEPGDTLADFSSRGPVTDNYDIKPDVVAPGVNIFSTYPEFIHSKEEGIDYSKAYSSISGTSMATPHVAGVAALLLQQHPEYDVNDVKAALANTADPLAKDYNVYEVGAGRVDAYEAVHSDNLIQVLDKTTSLDNNGNLIQIDDITSSLGYGALYQTETTQTKTLPIQLSNASSANETFEVSVQFLNITNNSGTSLDATANGVKVTVPTTVTVNSNGSAKLDATINIPTTAAKGMYQGYVYFKNKNNSDEVFQVPFAVKYTEKGFAYATTDRYAASNNWENYHPAFWPFVSGILKLNSPMKTIDVVINSLKTGKPIGYVAQLDATEALPEIEYYLFPMFGGYYSPILSKNEIGKPTLLPTGEYKISFIGTDEMGATYEVGNPLIIDNTKPKMTYKTGEEPGLREVTKANLTTEKDNKGVDHEALWFHGNIYDSTVERLSQLGYKVDPFGYPMDQSANGLVVYQDSAFPSAYLAASKTGDFKFGVGWDELSEYPTQVSLYGFDYATAGNMDFDKFFIAKEDQTYSVTSYSKSRVKLGDTFTATLSVENAKNLTSVTFKPYIGKQYKVKPVLNPTFVEAVKKAGGTAKITDLSTEFETIYQIDVSTGIAVSGDLKVLDLQATVVSDNYYYGKDGFSEWTRYSYTDNTGTKRYLPTYIPGFEFVPKSSTLELYLGGGEALQDNWEIDYTKLGARAWLVDKNGKFYNATIDTMGIALFEGIPAKKEAYKLYVDIPGHFLYASPVTLSKKLTSGETVGASIRWYTDSIAAADVNRDSNINKKGESQIRKAFGETIGVSIRWYTDSIAAGDVNRDGKIDKKDESQIRKAFGKTGGYKVVEDLNKDNLIDDNDVAFVIKNNKLRNPYPVVKKEIR